MGKVFSVSSFDEMEKTAVRLEELSEIYTDIYKQLMQEASTMGTAWEGADNLAFVTRITGFTEELQTMAAKLKLAGETLKKQKGNYVAQQNNNISEVNKLVN